MNPRKVWTRDIVCPPDGVDTVHDVDRTVWRRQPDRRWLADHLGATPGSWEDLVRVFGPITEGLPPARAISRAMCSSGCLLRPDMCEGCPDPLPTDDDLTALLDALVPAATLPQVRTVIRRLLRGESS